MILVTDSGHLKPIGLLAGAVSRLNNSGQAGLTTFVGKGNCKKFRCSRYTTVDPLYADIKRNIYFFGAGCSGPTGVKSFRHCNE